MGAVGVCGSWWELVGIGGNWWELVGVGGSWWELVGVGGSWWALVGAGGSWYLVGASLRRPWRERCRRELGACGVAGAWHCVGNARGEMCDVSCFGARSQRVRMSPQGCRVGGYI